MDLKKGESHSIPFKSQQYAKAPLSICFIELGKVILFNFEQLANAYFGI